MRFVLTQRRRRAREDALAWLARLKRGLHEREGPQLLAWLQRRSHRTLIAKAAAEWHGPEVLAVLSEIFPIDPQILAPPPRRGPGFIAVVVLISVGLTLTPFVLARRYLPLLFSQRQKVGSLIESLGHLYATSLGDTRGFTLEDGTRIELNGGTRLSVLYSEHARTVFVSSGEASFTVASEPYRPFTVIAASRSFDTDAATFDVHVAAPDRMEITVLEGTVRVFPPLRRTLEHAGAEQGDDTIPSNPALIGALQTAAIAPEGDSARTLTEQEARTRLSWRRSL